MSSIPQVTTTEPEIDYVAERLAFLAPSIAQAQALTADQIWDLFEDAQEKAHDWLKAADAPDCVDFIFQNLATLYAGFMLKQAGAQIVDFDAALLMECYRGTPELIYQVKSDIRLLKVAKRAAGNHNHKVRKAVAG
jgi:hypothetical protein